MLSVSIRDKEKSKRVGVDELTGGLYNIDIMHEHIHKGKAFNFSHFFPDVSNGATVACIFRAHSGVTPHFRGDISVGGDCHFLFMEDVTLSYSGTTGTPVNRNRHSSKESKVSGFVLSSGVTSYSGTTLLNEFIPGGTKGFAAGGAGGEVDEWCMDPSGSTYIIAIRNMGGASKNIGIKALWYEEGRSD